MSTTSIYQSLSHSKWECKYHIVFGPKYRKKILYGKIRDFLKVTFHDLARQKNCEIISGNLAGDHIHMLISIPPKYKVCEVVGYLKGKSAIAIARHYAKKTRNFNGESFWSRGYAVSTVGFEQNKIKEYIKNQQKFDFDNPVNEDGNF